MRIHGIVYRDFSRYAVASIHFHGNRLPSYNLEESVLSSPMSRILVSREYLTETLPSSERFLPLPCY
jgi:hypothetical protein